MLIIGTRDGMYRWDERANSYEQLGLSGCRIRDLSVRSDGTILAVESGRRVWSGYSNNSEWTDITPTTEDAPTTVLSHEGGAYLGVEPPALYRQDAAEAWQLIEPLHERDYARGWFAPGGLAAVRSVAAHPGNPDGLYLDIHVGGIMRTLDGGSTWQPASDGLEMDVHEVTTHPHRPNAVYTATADGFYYSADEANTWERRNDGLDNLYTRGIAVHPDNPDVILISGSPTAPPGWRGNGKRFALYRTENGGRLWHRITDGLPAESPEEIDTFCLAFSKIESDHVYCGRRDGILYRSRDAGVTWETVTEDLPGIFAIKATV